MESQKLAPEELKRRWHGIRHSKEGAKALNALLGAGWRLANAHFSPGAWPGIIAAIPSLPNKKAGTTLYPRFKSVKPLASFLRAMAKAQESGIDSVEAFDPKNRRQIVYFNGTPEIAPSRLCGLADSLEDLLLRRRWCVTRHNPQQDAIASLRGQIRLRTLGKPLDVDKVLHQLLRAAWRAAGRDEGDCPSEDVLRKSEQHKRATRAAGAGKMDAARTIRGAQS